MGETITPARRAAKAAWMRAYRARTAPPRPSRPPRQAKYRCPVVSIEQRFWAYVDVSGECWMWTGGKHHFGYGIFHTTARSSVLTHRFAWEFENGPIPDGMYVLHHCDNPPCVRPDHLWLGTREENNRDRDLKGRSYRGRRLPLAS